MDFTLHKRTSLGYKKGVSPLPPELKKQEQILFRLSKEEKNYLDFYCNSRNLKKSDFLRSLISEKMKVEISSNLAANF